jgi:hypothetical protein
VDLLPYYTQIVVGDFEYGAAPGAVPEVRCGVFTELRSAKTTYLWLEGGPSGPPPFDVGDDTLFVSFYAAAEMSCFTQFGWQTPRNVLDLYAEFCREVSGLPYGRKNLLRALQYYEVPCMSASEKREMRNLALRGGPYTPTERQALLDYCAEDVRGTAALFRAMLPAIDLPRALLRGRYTIAVARIEAAGVPIDTGLWARLRGN